MDKGCWVMYISLVIGFVGFVYLMATHPIPTICGGLLIAAALLAIPDDEND